MSLFRRKKSSEPKGKLFSLIDYSKWDEASVRCKTHPQDARWKDGAGWLPIHLACGNGAPLSLIRQLHEAYGEGIRTTDKNGSLPLHYACRWSSLEVITYLHGQYPQGATKKDKYGDTPADLLKGNIYLSEEDNEKARDILSSPPGSRTTTPPRPQPTKLTTPAGTTTPVTTTPSNTAAPTRSTRAREVTTTSLSSGGSPQSHGSPKSPTTSTWPSTSSSPPPDGGVVDDTFSLGDVDAAGEASVGDEVRRALDAVDAAVSSRARARGEASRLAAEAAAAGDASGKARTAAERLDVVKEKAGAAVAEAGAAVRAAQKVFEEAERKHEVARQAAELGRGKADAADRDADRLRREAEKARAKVGRTDEAVENAVARMKNVKYRVFAPDRDRLKPFLESTGQGSPVEAVELSLEYVKCCTNDFSDEHRLGEGAFGVVYRGYDDVLQRRFAVKRIKYEIRTATDQNDVRATRKLLENELKVLNEFQHSHIARLYGYILTENLQDEQILVYELASRGSLHSFFESEAKRSELPWQRRVLIALQVASAIRFLHEGGGGGGGGGGTEEHYCYHRDVKSANVCLRADYSAVLIDCGLAKMIPKKDSRGHGWTATTRSGGQPGTIEYMCPLYASGLPVSDRTDVFAFGVVLFEIFAGRLQLSRPDGFYDRYVSDACGGPGDEFLVGSDIDEAAGMWKTDAQKDYCSLALECIRTKPNDRPTMREVFHRLSEIAQAHCFLKPEEVEEIQLGKQASSYECVLDIVEEIRANQEETIAKQKETNATLNVIGAGVQVANARMDEVLGRLQWMTAALTSVVRGQSCPCPRLAILVPSSSSDRVTLRSPSQWLAKDVHLYFLCACDLTPVQSPVVLRVTRRWLEKAMPYLKFGMFVLKAASAGGSLATGQPFEVLPGLVGETLQLLDTGYAGFMGSMWHGDLQTYCESLSSAKNSGFPEPAVARGKALTDEAYKVVAEKSCEQDNKSWAHEMELVESGREGLVWIKRENKPRLMQHLDNS